MSFDRNCFDSLGSFPDCRDRTVENFDYTDRMCFGCTGHRYYCLNTDRLHSSRNFDRSESFGTGCCLVGS